MKECKEDELRGCLNKLQHSVIDHFNDVQNVNKQEYCDDIDKGKQCMDEAMENCQDKHAQMSNIISSFYIYLNHICTDKGKAFMDIVPCLNKHASKFEKCKFDDTVHGNPMEEICKEADYLKCVASLSKQVCDEGKSFGEAVDPIVSNLQANVCTNNSNILGHNYWILTAVLLVMFSIRRML